MKFAFNPHERIKRAAVRVNGEVHEGVSHFDAIENASKKTGKSFDSIVDSHHPNELEGFTTNSNRFVSRLEAARIANRSGQAPIERGKFNTYLRRPAVKSDE